MASTLASTSRLRLEDWDSLTLTPAQKTSISQIEAAASVRPIPAQLLAKQDSSAPITRSATPIEAFGRKRLDASRPASPRAAAHRLKHSVDLTQEPPADPLQITAPIETTQQFYDWFGRVEESIEREQEESYRSYLNQVEAYIDACDEIVDNLEESRGLVHEMEANYKFVQDNSRALQVACENMLEDQKHLIEVSEAIASRLSYFDELENAVRMLNSPGESIVLSNEFLNLLDRLDVCLDYLKANRSFKDAEIYLIRFQQCLTRSMTLIKMYFVNTVTSLGNEVSEKTGNKNLSETAFQALLYNKFASAAEPIRVLTFELERRAQTDPNEYGALLAECYATWFSVRNSILSATVAEEIRRMDPYGTDLVSLTRVGLNYMRSVCTSEWNLFRDYFSRAGQEEIYRYLESLCDRLFDFLRPRILHEMKLDSLCELCTVLQALMAVDVEHDDEAESEAAFPPSAMTPPAQNGKIPASVSPLPPLRFGILLESVLQDVQTRLVFRAQAVIQAEVLHYVPATEDLEFPEKIKQAKRMSLWMEESSEGSSSKGGALQFRLPPDEVQQTWYMTLRKTLWVLSKLHTYVKDAIFEDFAGEAVTLCRQSLSSASEKVAARQNATRLDGQLFAIRHLLILKEMVRSVDLVHVERAADFSSVTDALTSLLRNTSAFLNPTALFEMAYKGMPNFAETMKDAKIDLDVALKAVCEDLIANSALSIAAPLRSFLSRSTSYLATKPTSGTLDLTAQEWATPDQVKALHTAFIAEGGEAGMEGGMAEMLAKLNTWLSDKKAVAVLIPPIQEEVYETYLSFYNLVRSEYDFEVSSTLLSPNGLRDRLSAIAETAGARMKS